MARVTMKDLQSIVRNATDEVFADKWLDARRNPTSSPKAKGMLSSMGKQRPVDGEEVLEPGILSARCIRAMYQAGGNAAFAAEIAMRQGQKSVAKALSESSLTGGGGWLPPQFSADITAALRAKAVVRSLNATVMPMNSGSLTMPFIGTGASAYYTAENTNITKTEPVAGQLQFFDHKLAALIPVSNDLLRSDANAAVDAALRNDIVNALRAREDLAFIRGDGTAGEPRGLKSWVVSGNVITSNGTPTVATVTDELMAALSKPREQNVDLDAGGGYIIPPRVWKYLMGLVTSTGEHVFREEMSKGTINGYPFRITSQIPINLGGGTETEVYFAAFPYCVIAENENMIVEMLPNASWYDGSAVQSGVSSDQSVFRAISLHDFGCRYRGNEVSLIQTVKWGV